ncbi:hypothetical protein EXIGLDRAFT_746082 [Exidia glandulosa HHB12029]|uniref:Uncharacterized protein n=1 Tax=Exidia glandulosa HHB12029 TaxID=1314781 RepID=A0A165MLI7_EXIGL|nr:hypothetical protein EXIGLDRAFT_746082 [Exidia glandulosa HHB12029]
MAATSSSPAPFTLFAERLDRNNARPWRVQIIPELREGTVQWVTHSGALQNPAVVLNPLRTFLRLHDQSRVANGTVGDVGYIDASNDTFRVLFNVLDPMATGCRFQCESITAFDNEEHTTHKLVIDFSKLFGFWRNAPPRAEISPDPYAAVDDNVDGCLTQRTLNLSSATRENWSEEYADEIVRSYPGVTRDGLYLVTETYAKTSAQSTPQQTMTVGMHVFTENLPAHMR